MADHLETYRKELIELLHKSQDAFEKQLSYISAGALALSIGFIKDVVKNLPKAEVKWLLALGWILLGMTLLINLTSHIIAAKHHNETIEETFAPESWNQETVTNRYKWVQRINWASLISLIVGIFFITTFIIINTLQPKT